MRTYVVVTGIIFGLVTGVHVWRIVEEPHLAREPWFVSLTLLTAGLCIAALRVVRQRP